MATNNGHITSANNLSITEAKGDLIVGGSTGQASTIGVGLDGQVLVADSTQSNGLKWDNLNLGINYIKETDGQQLGAWTTYKNADQAQPVTGTGNSPTAPTVTFVDSTDSSMRDTTNFLFTHGASNQRGEGFSYLCEIDPSDRGSVIRFSFEYLITSAAGSYADGDLTVWFQDATNNQIIQGAPTSILNSGIIETFQSEVQVPISCAQMRVIVHVSTSTATAYTMRFDNFAFGPQEKSYGSLITDATAYSATVTNVPTSTASFKYNRIGDSIRVTGEFVASGTGSGSIVYCSLPAGLTVDITKVMSGANGSCRFFDSGVINRTGVAYWAIAQSGIAFQLDNASTAVLGNTFTAGDALAFSFTVPILGWSSSSQVVSSEEEGRLIDFIGTSASVAATNTGDTALTASLDRVAAWNGTQYVVKVPGDYLVTGSMLVSNTATPVVYLNGSLHSYFSSPYIANAASSGAVLLQNLQVGNTISLRIGAASATLTSVKFSISKLQGPSQIMAGEKISASYWLPGNFAASTTVPINFSSKETDTHGSVTPSATAWKFTAPIAATFEVYAYLSNTTATQGVFTIYKNGSAYKRMAFQASANFSSGSTTVELLAGEYIDLRPSASVTIEGGSLNTASHISIVKVG